MSKASTSSTAASYVSPFAQRNRLIAAFRRKVYEANHITWFPHQAEWQLASEGYTLLTSAPVARQQSTAVVLPATLASPHDTILATSTVRGVKCVTVRRAITPRDHGAAHILADMAAYKGGKSFGGAYWLSGFAIVPYTVHLVGAEYSTSEPEFNYLLDALCGERGMNMKPSKMLNDRRQGRMMVQFATGATFECKTWERKEALKGKKILCYYYAEAYQLPGLEVFTSIAQNLRELEGFAAATTTPDRPWVGVFHDQGHGHDPDWHCTCSVDARSNPFTYDQRARDRDDPEKGGIMTRERFAIAWKGQLGVFIGRVYDIARGQRHFSPLTHPQLWNEQITSSVPVAAASSSGRTS